MKHLTLLATLLAAAVSSFAQDAPKAEKPARIFKPFKVDLSLGYAIPKGSSDGDKGGIIFAIEPKYAVIDNLAIGLRMEGAALARNAVVNGDDVTGDVAVNASGLLTGDYYFTNKKFRPFVGAGAGVYGVTGGDENTSSVDEIATESIFGFMGRIGFEAGHFRLGAEYNFIGDGDVYTNNGYFGIKAGFCIGGGRYKK